MGKFIVIEGGDGSGKTTQVALLVDALKKEGVPVAHMKFPRKETFYGSYIYECLDGKHGDFVHMDPYFAALPYMLDQVGAKEDIKQALAKGHLICDRYVPSNLAHQAAKFKSAEEEREFIEFIESRTYDEFHAVRPDLVVFLDVPMSASTRLMQESQKNDALEADLPYQESVRNIYRQLTAERPHWRRVDCATGGTLRSKASIHQEILGIVREAIATT